MSVLLLCSPAVELTHWSPLILVPCDHCMLRRARCCWRIHHSCCWSISPAAEQEAGFLLVCLVVVMRISVLLLLGWHA